MASWIMCRRSSALLSGGTVAHQRSSLHPSIHTKWQCPSHFSRPSVCARRFQQVSRLVGRSKVSAAMFNRVEPIQPKPGQESVWQYPRPPRCEPTPKRIQVIFNGETILDTTSAFRVLETSHPPTYYLPASEFRPGSLRKAGGSSYCEWKGSATYWDIVCGDKVASRVGWSYESPSRGFEAIKGHVALYAGPMDAVYVGGEKVTPQPGGFYGGWITEDVVGPFKGGPGSTGW
eukprot:TRINITY_DN19181_c0_g1_i1.p1 TRINITY_DN19181_c0_g1~~TRINITY_DN19181_c0_g1_i1.p1  ORF type:complete len:244 (-),score=12.50 TRINITY_DN19181_c0_g1_i1:203-898(-)